MAEITVANRDFDEDTLYTCDLFVSQHTPVTVGLSKRTAWLQIGPHRSHITVMPRPPLGARGVQGDLETLRDFLARAYDAVQTALAADAATEEAQPAEAVS